MDKEEKKTIKEEVKENPKEDLESKTLTELKAIAKEKKNINVMKKNVIAKIKKSIKKQNQIKN